jgi:hypothetical protein
MDPRSTPFAQLFLSEAPVGESTVEFDLLVAFETDDVSNIKGAR